MPSDVLINVLMIFVFAIDTHWLCSELCNYDVCDHRLCPRLHRALLKILPASEHRKLPPSILSATEQVVNGFLWPIFDEEIRDFQIVLDKTVEVLAQQSVDHAGLRPQYTEMKLILDAKIEFSTQLRCAFFKCSSGGDEDVFLVRPETHFKLLPVLGDGDCGAACILKAQTMNFLFDPSAFPADHVIDELAAQLLNSSSSSSSAALLNLDKLCQDILFKLPANFRSLGQMDSRRVLRTHWGLIKDIIPLIASAKLLLTLSDEFAKVVKWVQEDYHARSHSMLFDILQSEASEMLGQVVDLRVLDQSDISKCQTVIAQSARESVNVRERHAFHATILYFVLAISAQILQNVVIVRQSHQLQSGWETVLLNRETLGLPSYFIRAGKRPSITVVFNYKQHFDLLLPKDAASFLECQTVPSLPDFAGLLARILLRLVL